MTPAAMVVVCAIGLLGRSPESLPPIELLDVRPAHTSVNAEAFVEAGVDTIYLLTTSAVFQSALQAETRCGNTAALRKLASIIVHEEWHVLHGSDEEGAYAAQLTTLAMLGDRDKAVYHSVQRAMVSVLSQQRIARPTSSPGASRHIFVAVRTGAATIGLAIAMTACGPASIERSSTPRQISASGKGAYEAALVPRDGGFITAWYDTRDGNAEIYMRLLEATGNPAGPERRLTNGPEESYEPSIDRIGEHVVVAWYDKSRDGMLIPKLGQWNRNGANSWVRALAPRGRNPVVSVYAGDIFCAWIAPVPDGREFVWGGWWGTDGASRGIRMLAPAGKTTWNLNAVARGRRQAWVVFDATAGTRADELFLADMSDEGATVTRLTADDGVASKYADIAAGERVALTWYDERDGNKEVYLLAVAPDALTLDAAERGTRVTSTPGESIGAYAAWNEDRIGLAWSDTVDGQLEIYVQRFDSRGRQLSEARRVTSNRTSSLIPAIEPSGLGFALAWNEYTPAAEGHAGTSEIAFVVVR